MLCQVTTVTRVYRTYERVPSEALTTRDYDMPEEYPLGEYTDANLYAKPFKKYSSHSSPQKQRYDQTNGVSSRASHNSPHQLDDPRSAPYLDRPDVYSSASKSSASKRPYRAANGKRDSRVRGFAVATHGSWVSRRFSWFLLRFRDLHFVDKRLWWKHVCFGLWCVGRIYCRWNGRFSCVYTCIAVLGFSVCFTVFE